LPLSTIPTSSPSTGSEFSRARLISSRNCSQANLCGRPSSAVRCRLAKPSIMLCRQHADSPPRTTRASFIAISSRRTSSSPKTGASRSSISGLAKLIHAQTDSDGNAPTLTQGTDPGTVMGTAGYMSPEQVRAKNVDHRTDIFAFGAILYEMLSGRRAFQRSTSAETMTAILNDEPPAISQTGTNIPLALNRVVNRCLEKNPEQRFHCASDLAFAIDALSDSGASPAVAMRAPSRLSLGRTLVRSIALIAVVSLVAVAWLEIGNQNAAAPLRISAYSQLTHSGHAGYVAGTDGSRLYLTHVNTYSIEEVAVSGGEIETVPSITLPSPFLFNVSPDGSTLLVQSFKAETPSPPLYSVQVVGGAHRYLGDTTPASGTWSPDGKLVAYTTPNGDLNIVNSDGTGVHKLASVGGAASPLSWSPDGNTIRFSRDLGSLWEITSSGSNLHELLPGRHPSEQKCCGRWSPDGEFFVFLAGAFGPGEIPEAQIYALDERRGLFRRPAKEPIQLTSSPIEWSPPVFSKDGKKIFATGSTHAGELMRLDPKSNQFRPFLGGISADLIAFSKDGQSVAYVTFPDGILWRANRDGSDRIQLTSPPLRPIGAAWSPDGTELVFEAPSPQGPHLWIVPSTGGSPQRLLPEDSGPEKEGDWSPDGRKIAFATGELRSRESHIGILDLASHQISTLPGSDGKFAPGWSPDGQFISADSIDTSTLYIFDIKTQHWSALNTGTYAYAQWSSDSRSIYFLRWATDPAILRISATGGEAKLVASLKDFPFTGTVGLWFGLDPTDAPLMLRDASTTDVYALTLEEK
jgi:Tol biopolymer transport system component/serine/threonine protein kinase